VLFDFLRNFGSSTGPELEGLSKLREETSLLFVAKFSALVTGLLVSSYSSGLNNRDFLLGFRRVLGSLDVPLVDGRWPLPRERALAVDEGSSPNSHGLRVILCLVTMFILLCLYSLTTEWIHSLVHSLTCSHNHL
jgi:hypothetical protein